ncbi:MAG: hypothetical protein AB1404_12425 [Spirochaetota bacterium]|jgi:flagellar motor component MotA|nr:hypothetical protein [Treponema sp.]
MKKLRYVVGILLFLAIISLCVYGSGGTMIVFADILSALITVGVTIVLLRTGWTFREMGQAFSAAFNETTDREGLKTADVFFATTGNYLSLSAAFSILISVIIILKNLTDKDMLGPNLAVALISLLYAVLFQLIIVLPMRGMIQKKLK